MATSKELYAQRNQLIDDKAQFVSNVQAFISKCDEAISKSNSIMSICSSSEDTNILSLANQGGLSERLKSSLNNLKKAVEIAKDAACKSADKEITELGNLARAEALKEAAAALLKEKDPLTTTNFNWRENYKNKLYK